MQLKQLNNFLASEEYENLSKEQKKRFAIVKKNLEDFQDFIPESLEQLNSSNLHHKLLNLHAIVKMKRDLSRQSKY
jgi:hypothetical protein